jgi:EAL domain-containing protein (putative c-di-GMP-specific phosphodiesterase class I)
VAWRYRSLGLHRPGCAETRKPARPTACAGRDGPIVDLATGRIVGAEALARFASEPGRGPNEWFAEAIDVGLGADLELAAVRVALQGLDAMPGDSFVSLNVSPQTAISSSLARIIREVPGRRVVLELTEHTQVEDHKALVEALDALRDTGVRVAVDDTGAGWTGLAHILRLRPDIIKLDTVLTSRIHADPVRRALAASLVSFAGDIGALIVADGIECDEELATLRALRVPWGQGYHLVRPGPSDHPSLPDVPSDDATPPVVPAAHAAVFNVTVTQPDHGGYLTVYPCGSTFFGIRRARFDAQLSFVAM